MQAAESVGRSKRSFSAPVDGRSSRRALQSEASSRSPATMLSTVEPGSPIGALRVGEQPQLGLSSKGQPDRLDSVSQTDVSSAFQPESALNASSSLESSETQIQSPVGGVRRWDTLKLVELGTAKLHQRQSSHERHNSSTCEIVVEASDEVSDAQSTCHRLFVF